MSNVIFPFFCGMNAATGVENDDLTQLSARIMILSIVPFVVAQLPSIFNFSATGNIPVLVACVLAFAGLVSYCLYQVCYPHSAVFRYLRKLLFTLSNAIVYVA